MRIEDIFNHQAPSAVIMEAPYGAIASMGDKIGAKFGSNRAKGRQETGKEANSLFKRFKKFAGKTGSKTVTGEDLANFLQTEGFPATNIDSNKDYGVKDVQGLLKQVVQDGVKQQTRNSAAVQQKKQNFAAPEARTNQSQQQSTSYGSQPEAEEQPQFGEPNAQAQAASQTSNTLSGPESAMSAETPQPQQDDSGVLAQINQLSRKDREKLIAALQASS